MYDTMAQMANKIVLFKGAFEARVFEFEPKVAFRSLFNVIFRAKGKMFECTSSKLSMPMPQYAT
ncbi:hypothetical protein CIK78_09025 [Halomonas sp. JB37]|nr:hypothetical protein CIK78_09025 [Halomonas sp. JB37]